jgi:FMN phosphatase YigB (HAD superfamily)
MIKAIIFDCFGVIRVDATNIAYEKLGGDLEKDYEFIRDNIAKSNAGLIPSAAPIFAERLGVSEAKWRETVSQSSVIDHDILDHIKDLRKSYKTAMLSNVIKGGLEIWFEPGFLERYFEVCVASGDIGFAKPEPQAYEIVADRLGVRLDECVMIDDRLELCEGAISVGMQAIMYKSLGQLKKDLGQLLSAGTDH